MRGISFAGLLYVEGVTPLCRFGGLTAQARSHTPALRLRYPYSSPSLNPKPSPDRNPSPNLCPSPNPYPTQVSLTDSQRGDSRLRGARRVSLTPNLEPLTPNPYPSPPTPTPNP